MLQVGSPVQLTSGSHLSWPEWQNYPVNANVHPFRTACYILACLSSNTWQTPWFSSTGYDTIFVYLWRVVTSDDWNNIYWDDLWLSIFQTEMRTWAELTIKNTFAIQFVLVYILHILMPISSNLHVGNSAIINVKVVIDYFLLSRWWQSKTKYHMINFLYENLKKVYIFF